MTPKKKEDFIVATANLKGGGGKTTLAVHLAYVLGATLLDLDPQGDAADWCERSGLVVGHHVPHGTDNLQARLDATEGPIVLDTQPGESMGLRSALLLADVLVIPVKPGSSDLRALGRMQVLIKEAKAANRRLKVAVVLNESKTVSTLSHDVEEVLEALKGVTYLGHLGDRVAIPEAFAHGEVVKGSAAADEIMNIATNLSNLLKG